MQKYNIKTERLGFRLLHKTDLDYLAILHSDAEVRYFFPEGALNRQQTQARIGDFLSFYEEQGLPCFMMFELATDEFVGRCGFGPIESDAVEVGYVLHKKFWGNGYATEALNFLLTWAQENIATNYIIAMTPVEHKASERVMQKAGMEYYKQEEAKGTLCRFYRAKNHSNI